MSKRSKTIDEQLGAPSTKLPKKIIKKMRKQRQRDMATALTATNFMAQVAQQWFTQVLGVPKKEVVFKQEQDTDPASPVLWHVWVEVAGLKRFSVSAFQRDGKVCLIHNWTLAQEPAKELN